MDTQRLILFIVFSFSLLLLWQEWEKQHQPAQVATAPATLTTNQNAIPGPATNLSGPSSANEPRASQEVTTFQHGQLIKVTTDLIEAELDTAGGDIRRLALLKHQIKEDGKEQNLVLLDDKPPHHYVMQSGFVTGDNLPNHKSIFTAQAASYSLAKGQDTISVNMTWKGENGLSVDKTFTFHRGSYLVDTTFKIHNGSDKAISPTAYFQLVRDSTPPTGEPKFVHTYTGPALYTEAGKFQKFPFTDIEKAKEIQKAADNGWVSMLQHYFLTAILPPGKLSREFYMKDIGNGLFSAGVKLPLHTITPGSDTSLDVPVYAGPQEQEALKKLAPGLDLTVDYGMLTVIATPLFWFLSLIHKLVDNWGVAIILLTILVKGAFYPLSAKSYKSMAQMRVLSPKLKRLKETYGDDRQKLHQAMMDLYKTEKINPLGGCLPVVVQIPVFMSLYWVLMYSVELRQAPFVGWIHDLSAPDTLFGIIPIMGGIPIGLLPILMGISMIVQTRLNPTPPDPIQAKVMMVMPVAFSVFFLFFPSGLVLYWLVNNIISIIQQTLINRSIEHAKVAKGSSKR